MNSKNINTVVCAEQLGDNILLSVDESIDWTRQQKIVPPQFDFGLSKKYFSDASMENSSNESLSFICKIQSIPRQFYDAEKIWNQNEQKKELVVDPLHKLQKTNEQILKIIDSPSLQKRLMTLYEYFSIREEYRVFQFFKDNPEILQLAIDSQHQIRQHIRTLSELVLEVVSDPESEDAVEMVIYILTELDPVDALKQLSDFDNKWWLGVPFKSREKLSINLEFK